MSNEDGKTPKKKRFTGVHKKTWTLREDPDVRRRYYVLFRDTVLGTIQPYTKDWRRWRFELGGKLSFRSYKSKELALVAMRNRIRQRQCLERKREHKEPKP